MGRPARRFASRMSISNGQIKIVPNQPVSDILKIFYENENYERFSAEYLRLSIREVLRYQEQLDLFDEDNFILESSQQNLLKRSVLDKVFDLIFFYDIDIEIVRKSILKLYAEVKHYCPLDQRFSMMTEDKRSLIINTLSNKAFKGDTGDFYFWYTYCLLDDAKFKLFKDE